MNNENEYVPVIIPTLNRYEHLRRCIESLQRNTLAGKTEIYISIDYPPSEEFVDGWKLVKQFLSQKIIGFKKVNVFYQNDNLGAQRNFEFLIEQVSIKYDAWISSEDDNEFSPNYLTFMNQAVEYMRHHEEIYSVCGHVSMFRDSLCNKIEKKGYNSFRIQNLDAWGYACIRERDQKLRQSICFKYLEDIISDHRKREKLRCASRELYRYCMFGFLGKVDSMLSNDKRDIIAIDITSSIYLIMNDMYQLQPVVSKVRNWGNDGSGLHCGVDESIKEQVLDEKTDFELNVLPLELLQKEIRYSVKNRIKAWNGQYIIACILNVIYCIWGRRAAVICYDMIFGLYGFIKRVAKKINDRI